MNPAALLIGAADQELVDKLTEMLPWLIPVLIALVAGLGRVMKLVMDRRIEKMREQGGEGHDAQGRKTSAPPQARPRRSIVEEIRRYIEALDQPVKPPEEKAERAEERRAPAPAAPHPPVAPLARVPAPRVGSRPQVEPTIAERAPTESGPEIEPDRPKRKSVLLRAAADRGALVGSPRALRRAIVLSEILGPPVSERDPPW